MAIDDLLKNLGIKPLRKTYIPPDTDEFKKIEKIMNSPIPQKYKDFVSRYGCSRFSGLASVICYADGNKYPLGLFYGGGQLNCNLLEMVNTFHNRMPNTVIPIACDVFGNQFCLCVKSDEIEKVFYWDHEEEPDPDDYLDEGEDVPPDIWFQNMTLIADSFVSFIKQIVIE
ncbi:SMI1/KNR4 family protein [candidate division CSSED10-310 bacterium]|uniref:SMI1/KNR4 family protein n=1 Tax=candidate division CSSED10-310 bacterium TaxID=2855610 RepID=A0ABV6Z239_UNCC1